MNKLIALLSSLNLLERGNKKLSISNIAVIVCIVKIAVSSNVSVVEIGALLLSLLNYAHKRTENNKIIKNDQEKLPDSSNVLAQVEELRAKLEQQSKELEIQGKVVEDAKSLITGTKLANSQKRQQL